MKIAAPVKPGVPMTHANGDRGEHEARVAGHRKVGDVLVGHEEDDDVGENEEGEEIKEKHRPTEVALALDRDFPRIIT